MRMEYGISGMKVYVPRPRVQLEKWCEWTGGHWGKTKAVVGNSFRMKAPHESIYTMAANAVLRLLIDYQVDPARVGFLGFGTESSTDNSAGAVIVKGMVNRALRQLGQPELPRHCEVPELKHACLGGVYALKGALRYLAHDGEGRLAIVVCGDIAEYERGSSGEPTQGAGAVAMLVEEQPALLSLDLRRSGSAAAYRGPDFRKPTRRYFMDGYARHADKLHDFPVFSGKYSTICYVDATVRALEDMLTQMRVTPRNFYHGIEAVFMHRPYRHMPINAMAALYTWGLAHAGAHLPELSKLCEGAGVQLDQVIKEMRSHPDLFEQVLQGNGGTDVYGNAMKAVRFFRSTDKFKEVVEHKMALGSALMMEMGNLYSASLPAWIAAGFTEAAQDPERDLANKEVLLVGYGSGDASEAIPARVQPGWRDAARRIGFQQCLEAGVDLDQGQYEALHDRGELDMSLPASGEFVIERIGDRMDADFQDIGLEYYQYVP
ncbi:MAG: hydroxymethylglutaryl-CoA synthase [Nannocystaceae bacterium]